MMKFLLGAVAAMALAPAAMAGPAVLSDGQLDTVAAGEVVIPSLGWQLIATNTNTNTAINTNTTTTQTSLTNTLNQVLTGGSSNNVYNVALSSNGAYALGSATTTVSGVIAAP